MNLYSTTTSERASKSQGGNEYLDTIFRVGDTHDNKVIGTISLSIEDDEWSLCFIDSNSPNSKPLELKRGQLKDNKQCPTCLGDKYICPIHN